MSCDAVGRLIPLYFYGELPPDEEERVEAHLHDCSACAGLMETQRRLAGALDDRAVDLPPLLLEECRADLMAAVDGALPRRAISPAKGPWRLFLEAMAGAFSGFRRLQLPAGAVALVAVGFFAARVTQNSPVSPAPPVSSDQVFSTVRSVRADDPSRIEISLDETRRRLVSGSLDDPDIQQLLLTAAHEDNAAVRVSAVDLMKQHADSGEVRDALLNALAHDSNPGVRQKALEALKPAAGDPMVRKILAQVLQADDNPAVRMQAVDLLVARRDDSLVGVLQRLVQREDNDYIRLKAEKALKDMNASVGTF